MAKPKSPRPDIGRMLASHMAASEDLRTQQALEKKSKVPQSTIGRILRGETNPSIGVLEKLAHALGISVNELTGTGTVQGGQPSRNSSRSDSREASQPGRLDADTIMATTHALLTFLRRRDPEATLDLRDPADAALFASVLSIVESTDDQYEVGAQVADLVREREARRGAESEPDSGAAGGKARKAGAGN